MDWINGGGVHRARGIAVWTPLLVALSGEVGSQSHLGELFGIDAGRDVRARDTGGCVATAVHSMTTERLLRRSCIYPSHFLCSCWLGCVGIGSTRLCCPDFCLEADARAAIRDLGLPRDDSTLLALLLHELVLSYECSVDCVGSSHGLAS